MSRAVLHQHPDLALGLSLIFDQEEDHLVGHMFEEKVVGHYRYFVPSLSQVADRPFHQLGPIDAVNGQGDVGHRAARFDLQGQREGRVPRIGKGITGVLVADRDQSRAPPVAEFKAVGQGSLPAVQVQDAQVEPADPGVQVYLIAIGITLALGIIFTFGAIKRFRKEMFL